jgi:hypothetical protein
VQTIRPLPPCHARRKRSQNFCWTFPTAPQGKNVCVVVRFVRSVRPARFRHETSCALGSRSFVRQMIIYPGFLDEMIISPCGPRAPVLAHFACFRVAALLMRVGRRSFSVDVRSTFPRGWQNRSFTMKTRFAAPETESMSPLPMKRSRAKSFADFSYFRA